LPRRRRASRVNAFTHSDCLEMHRSLADICGIFADTEEASQNRTR
jgi:hypothetical protein